MKRVLLCLILFPLIISFKNLEVKYQNSYNLLSFVETTIAIDGDFSDWTAVLQEPQNVITDGAKGAGDPDDPGQTSSDLRIFALTWDDSNLYAYFKRATTSSSGITYLIYLDKDNDGLMESSDLCLFWTFNNSGFQGFNLYSYVPVNPSGDLILGDGYTMPGGVGTLLSTNGNGAMETEGTRFEVSVSFFVLGIEPKSPMNAKPSLTLGTNIPNQVEDNGDILNTLVQKIDIEPERETSAKPGTTVSFSHTITNLGNSSEIIEIEGISMQGWEISFWDSTGNNLLPDTNGNGKPDTGALGINESFDFIVKIEVPSSVPTQTNDEIYIKVFCFSNSSIQDSLKDKIYAGFVVTFKKDQEKWAMPNTTVPFYGQVVENLTESTITIDVSSLSNNGWTTEVYLDSNCDESYESGPLTQFQISANSSICLITYVYVPSYASIGTKDTTETKISFGSPLIEISVYSITNVEESFNFAPSQSSSNGAGEAIFYKHYIRNNQNYRDLFDFTFTSSLGWNVALFKSDKVTPLPDSNGNGKPDTGSISPFGGYFEFYVRVSIPSNATYNQQDITTIYAKSVATSEEKNVQDTTTVKVLVTFEDGSYSIPKSVFPPCSGVFFKAFSLSNGTYRFMVYDPLNTLKTTSPAEYTPDQSGQVWDSYNLEINDLTGTWSVKLQKKQGNNWIDQANYIAYFNVVNNGSISIGAGRSVYNKTNETLTILANLQNSNETKFFETTISYVVFFDTNSNNIPDTGEPYIASNGTVQSYSSGLTTHTTYPFDIEKNSTKQDLWSIFVSNFIYSGTWKILGKWYNSCLNLISENISTFSVVDDSYPPYSQITNITSGQNLYLSSSPFRIEGTAYDNETYVAEVRFSVDGGSSWANAIDDGGNFSNWHYDWAPFYRGSYNLVSKAKDAVGNFEVDLEIIPVNVIDDTPPTEPSVTDNGNYTINTLSANWYSEDPNSGILYYEYCIGTSISLCDIVPFTNVGVQTSITRNDLNLTNGQTYYFRVKATNLDGYTSEIGLSDGIICDKSAPVSTITDPPASSTIYGKTYTIIGNTFDALSGVSFVEISTNGGNSYEILSGTTNWSYNWTLPPDGNYCLKARGTDNLGNLEIPNCHWVYVNSFPLPPSNFQGQETGFCQVLMSWEKSPSSDIAFYNIYSDQGSGVIDYTTPIKKVSGSITSWTTPRGIYGYCGTQISLTKESSQYNQIHFDGINTNKTNYNISGLRVSWDIPGPDIRVDKVYLNSNLVFQAPPGAPSNNGELLTLNDTNVLAGGIFNIQIDFKYVSGGDPNMEGKSINVKFSGGGWSPYISLKLNLSGQYPDPCENSNLGSVEPLIPYKFGIRAEDSVGQEEENTSINFTITVCNSSPVQVQLKSPYSGLKIEGQEVTIYAEISKGSLEDLQDVTFQYKGSGDWTNMVSSHNYFSNPDNAEPFFIYWDISSFPSGIYEVRAVARDKMGVYDLYPFETTIEIEHIDPNLYEDTNGSGLHETIQDISPSSNNPITQGENVDDFITYANIYSGSFLNPTRAYLTLEDPLEKQSLVPINWEHSSEFRNLITDSGESTSNPFILKLFVNDMDNDKKVDSTGVNIFELLLYRYDGIIWNSLPTEINLITKEIKGFSTNFGLFAPLKAPYESDLIPPKEVNNLKLYKNGGEIIFTWDPVLEDINNNPETVKFYYIYRGTAPSFTIDKIGRTNLFAISSSLSFTDNSSLKENQNFYYLITAVDIGGNEGD